MNAVNLILYGDKPNRRFQKAENDVSKLSKNELNLNSLKSFNEDSIILLLEEMVTDKSLTEFMHFLVDNQEKLLNKKNKASLITDKLLSRAVDDFFHSVFNRVTDIQGRYLPSEELFEVLRAENRDELMLGAAIDEKLKIVTFTKGDLSTITVPYSFFHNVSKKIKMMSLELCDFGQTIKLGKFQISFDSILYEFSNEYRKKLIKRRRSENKTFGACLRRFRMLKGIKQSDFKSISEKEIGRIENELVSPHKKTVKKLLKELKITEEEMMSY